MSFPLLLALLLMADPAAQEPPRQGPTFAEAVQMANEGREADALAAFRLQAAANPADHEARLWIARLHERMGHPDLAEPVYRSVLLEDLTNLEARLGVASTLLARDESEDVVELLESAEEGAPQNVTILVLLGRAHRLAGRTTRALVYFERAAAVAPTEEHRLRLEHTRLSHFHRIETRGFSEQFSGSTPDSRSGDLMVNYRVSETLRVVGRGQAQRKFGMSEQRGGGGLEWRWSPGVTLRGQVLVGPGNLVMPEGDYHGEVEFTRGPATWTAAVRYFDFTGARTSLLSPAVSWFASERLSFGLRYATSWSESNTLRSGASGNSAHLRGSYRLYRRVWIDAGYAAGVEDFENFSVDRIGDFRANTVAGGVRIDLPTLTSVVGNYERQWRTGGVELGRVTVSLRQRF